MRKKQRRGYSWQSEEVKSAHKIEEYPNVPITVMPHDYAKDVKKNGATTETEFQLERWFKVIKYRLVSVVTTDISTGEIYAEERCNDDNWIRNAPNSERYKFEEKSDTKLRLMAIYELTRD